MKIFLLLLYPFLFITYFLTTNSNRVTWPSKQDYLLSRGSCLSLEFSVALMNEGFIHSLSLLLWSICIKNLNSFSSHCLFMMFIGWSSELIVSTKIMCCKSLSWSLYCIFHLFKIIYDVYFIGCWYFSFIYEDHIHKKSERYFSAFSN